MQEFMNDQQQEIFLPPQETATFAHVEVDSDIEEVATVITDYWWFFAIFAIGVVTVIVAGVRAIKKSKNPMLSELLKIWGLKK